MSKLGRLTLMLALGALALMPAAPPTMAQATGATDVSITLPDIVILHYFSTVNVTVTSTALGTFLTGNPGDSSIDEGAANPAAGGFSPDLAMSPSALSNNPAAAVLTLQNAWAVRAISLGLPLSETQLAITNTGATLNHATSAASMTISGVAVDDGTSNGATITFSTPGLFSPEVGDVELTLNMTNATDAGLYSGGQYTLTATNI